MAVWQLGSSRWLQMAPESPCTLLTILTDLSLPVGEEAAVSGGEALEGLCWTDV